MSSFIHLLPSSDQLFGSLPQLRGERSTQVDDAPLQVPTNRILLAAVKWCEQLSHRPPDSSRNHMARRFNSFKRVTRGTVFVGRGSDKSTKSLIIVINGNNLVFPPAGYCHIYSLVASTETDVPITPAMLCKTSMPMPSLMIIP